MSASASSASASTAAQPSATRLMVLQMIAGAGAGAFAKTATAPLERIKIIFQVQVRPRANSHARALRTSGQRLHAHPAHHPQGMAARDLIAPKYTGIWQAAYTVVGEEGALALWKGNLANVLRVIPVYGLKCVARASVFPSRRRPFRPCTLSRAHVLTRAAARPSPRPLSRARQIRLQRQH